LIHGAVRTVIAFKCANNLIQLEICDLAWSDETDLQIKSGFVTP
jgi:hypothetical protein